MARLTEQTRPLTTLSTDSVDAFFFPLPDSNPRRTSLRSLGFLWQNSLPGKGGFHRLTLLRTLPMAGM